MKIKRFFSLLVLITLSFILTGCMKQIEDTNGEDDFTIQTYTDDDITSGKSISMKVGSLTNTVNNTTTIKIKKFSGLEKLDTIKADNDTIEFNVESTVSSGNFRMVIIKEKEIIQDVIINTTDKITLTGCTGRYDLVMIGESAKINLKYTINIG